MAYTIVATILGEDEYHMQHIGGRVILRACNGNFLVY